MLNLKSFATLAKYSIYFKHLLYLSLLSCSSCISYGLPEPVSGLAELNGRFAKVIQPPTLALLTEGELPSKPESLGSQYLFGFIPLTSLYFAHGQQALLNELAIEVVRSKGMRAAITDKNSLLPLVSQLNVNPIVELKFESLRINAWDLLFFRKISIQGSIESKFYDVSETGGLSLIDQISSPIDATSYRSQAQGASLASFSHQAIKDSLKNSLHFSNTLTNRRARRVDTNSFSKPLILVLPPENTKIIAASLGKLVSSSYGFPSFPAYRPDQLARILQRGLMQGFANSQHPVSSLAGSKGLIRSSRAAKNGSRIEGSYLLKTHLQNLFFEENQQKVELELVFELSPIKYPSKNLLSGRCSSIVAIDDTKDGAWVFALEKAATEISEIIKQRETDSRQPGRIPSTETPGRRSSCNYDSEL